MAEFEHSNEHSSGKMSKVSEEKENVSCTPNASGTSSKRRLQDMFGEISDDDDDDLRRLCIDADLPALEPKSKRSRTVDRPTSNRPLQDDNVDDNFVITPPASPNKSNEKVDKNLSKLQTDLKSGVNRLMNGEKDALMNFNLERKRVHSRMPAGAFFNATTEDGRRAYMTLKSQDRLDNEIASAFTSNSSFQLLGLPLEVLKIQVDEQRRQRLLDEAEDLTQKVQGAVESPDRSEEKTLNERKSKGHSLWVERYAPSGYTQLLSDEATNRTLLKWLKLWDYVVFGKEQKDKDKKKQAKDSNKPEQKKFVNRNLPEVSEELDQYKRPMHKIILLSGPPGLGKTTLAHVIARHAGYNVVEMNASDDRSPELFKQRIEAATQMKAVLGADPRPNCLVIDEIDGAPQPAINMLLSIAKQTDQKNPTTTKRRKREGGLLMRPIICICNDLYVPALRQLRQNALVINFPPTVPVKLAGRLMEVARHEDIKADLTTLLALCEKAENDIRSCLNTLQFVRSRTKELSLQNVHSMSLGQKDAHKSLFTVWQHIFTMPRPKRKRYINPYDRATSLDAAAELALALENNNTSITARYHNTLQMALAAGEYKKVTQGMYENYLESKAKDPRMDSINKGLEWMQFIDVLDKEVGHSQNYSLARYNPYLSVIFHLMFASNNPNKIIYPHSQYEFTTKLSRTENLVSSMMNEVIPSVRRNLNSEMVVMEILPPLLGIIQPTLRPVNTQLYSNREKEDLAQLVRIMIAYNMTYHQERSIDGQYNYVLDPNMEEVTKYPGQKSTRSLTYAAKQLISREIETEKMRRSESSIMEKSKGRTEKLDKPAKDPNTQAAVANHLRQTLKPKPLQVPEAVVHAVDFFGRKIQHDSPADATDQKNEEGKPTVPPKKEKAKQEIIGGDIWFRFKEGFTNAVRRTVKVQDLI